MKRQMLRESTCGNMGSSGIPVPRGAHAGWSAFTEVFSRISFTLSVLLDQVYIMSFSFCHHQLIKMQPNVLNARVFVVSWSCFTTLEESIHLLYSVFSKC